MSTKGLPLLASDLDADTLCRLDEKIDYTGDCWLWMASTNQHGYGHLYLAGRYVYAHRVVFALTYGEVAAGAVLRHHCDTPGCVRPDHITSGTQADNMRDMAAKGRGVGRGNRRKQVTPTAANGEGRDSCVSAGVAVDSTAGGRQS